MSTQLTLLYLLLANKGDSILVFPSHGPNSEGVNPNNSLCCLSTSRLKNELETYTWSGSIGPSSPMTLLLHCRITILSWNSPFNNTKNGFRVSEPLRIL
ncbi:hypothetical protein BP00DRAFT_161010 [Aspergillus indologenus CBS 114.80]|uniref:Uncharacterized protein n=1 Tax=Aspergillus indologenus CBS 114.80 TaxID=1450541 RepID=A0A2V5I602_9EURO|nr:hypothetical protein BP00DRAFT_161010 [Aspergillus indologenus CBS 114.80]